MAVGHGKDARVYLNGYNISSFLKELDVTFSADVSETTTMGASAVTRIGGLKDSQAAASGYFDGATGQDIDNFHAALGQAADSLYVLWPLGETAIGSYGYASRSRMKDWSADVPVSGVVTAQANFEGDNLLERVQSIHVLGAETATGNSASLDGGAGSSNGGSVYVQCTAATALTSLIIVVQHSTDNAVWSTLATHTTITTANTSERISFSGTVNRYVRTSWTLTGTSVTFSEAFYRG